MGNTFFQKDIVSVRDFDKQKFEQVFEATDKIIGMNPNERRELARGKTLGYLFFEPSTRTRLSFEAAMASLGGTSIGIADASSSSARKGESLSDTVRIMSLYSDVVVLRHQLDGSSRFAAEVSEKPLINAGSGTEEHPTQAILDLYTMRKEKRRIDGLKIGIVGDLKYGRTVYSLLYALSNYRVDVRLISPPSLKVRSDSTYEIRKKLSYTEATDLEDNLEDLDVVYVTRIQKERFADMEEYMKVKGSYKIGPDLLNRMKDDVIIMHPLPRLDEVSHKLDSTDNAKYFKQAQYGKDTRAALLALVLNEKGL